MSDLDVFKQLTAEISEEIQCESLHKHPLMQPCTQKPTHFLSACTGGFFCCDAHVEWIDWAESVQAICAKCHKSVKDCAVLTPL